jgi:hypothetical protein
MFVSSDWKSIKFVYILISLCNHCESLKSWHSTDGNNQEFSLVIVQTGFGAHPATNLMGTGAFFPEHKVAGA